MFSRDGMALHGEFAMTKTAGVAPLSGDAVWGRSVLLAFDFAF
jgi:hypothetical protein